MVDEFKIILIMNETVIMSKKEKNENYEKNKRIKKYLEDEALFFKITKKNAYNILLNVGIKPEQQDKVYKKLTCADEYFKLIKKGKINENDKLTIRYNAFRK